MKTEFVDQLSKVSRKWRTLFDARVKTQGLTLARARTLLHLMDQDGLTQKDLADQLGIENATMVRLLDGLERQGMVERRVVEGDRRAKQVTLSAAARRQAEEIRNHAYAIRDEALAGVAAKDLEVAIRVLRQISARLESMK